MHGNRGGRGATLGEMASTEWELLSEFQWHWAEPCGANFVAWKAQFKFCAIVTVWESEFSLQWRCIKNSVVNGLLLYSAVCAAILCITSGPATLDQCTLSDIVLFSGILHADFVREEDSQVISF